MKIVIFGLTISSAWGNGHATLWRGLCRGLHALGHDLVFFEKDVPYYAHHRDMHGAEWCRLVLYEDWSSTVHAARRELADADVGMVTSYCPDGPAASRLVLESHLPRRVFYDLDAPVTLDRLSRNEPVAYLPPEGLAPFDLVLSYTGGLTLSALRERLGARVVAPLYGSVDPDVHRPVAPDPHLRNDFSYLGTYAADRDAVLDALFLEPARRRSDLRFALAGSQYPAEFAWTPNIYYLWHMPPGDHPSFFCSSAFTLNITRAPMAAVGHCPSGRLFEAAACGTPIVSDWWEGFDGFFEPGREILIARGTDDVLAALDMSRSQRERVAAAARERTLACHTSGVRARELEALLEQRPSGASANGAERAAPFDCGSGRGEQRRTTKCERREVSLAGCRGPRL